MNNLLSYVLIFAVALQVANTSPVGPVLSEVSTLRSEAPISSPALAAADLAARSSDASTSAPPSSSSALANGYFVSDEKPQSVTLELAAKRDPDWEKNMRKLDSKLQKLSLPDVKRNRVLLKLKKPIPIQWKINRDRDSAKAALDEALDARAALHKVLDNYRETLGEALAYAEKHLLAATRAALSRDVEFLEDLREAVDAGLAFPKSQLLAAEHTREQNGKSLDSVKKQGAVEELQSN